MMYTVLGVENDESCLGACDGAIKVDVTGGVSPYVAMATETTTGALITLLWVVLLVSFQVFVLGLMI